MNRLSKRALFALILAGVLLLGLMDILVQYFLNGSKWVSFQNSPHLYSNGTLKSGKIEDRNGYLLLNTEKGVCYAESKNVRKSFLQILGDKEGNVVPYLLNQYGNKMTGYNQFLGVTSKETGTMILTISAEAQKTAIKNMQDRKGTVAVYNYKTGEILCWVSTPTYDPDNVPNISEEPDKYEGVYLNRFTQVTYTPGSIFKLVTAAAAIDNIKDLDDRVFECNGSCFINGETIVCNHLHGEISFKEALARSCNVAFAQLSVELGESTLQRYATKIGMMNSIKFDGFTTKKGSFNVNSIPSTSLAWAGIGQYTDQINPCQYLTYVGAIANGGKAAKPYVVQEIKTGNKTSYHATTHQIDRVLSENTAEKLSDIMIYGVNKVYGNSYFAGQIAGAKSGTAEVGNGLEPNALFTGFLKSEKYPLAFIVIVENGGAGSKTCTPIIGSVLQACIKAIDSES